MDRELQWKKKRASKITSSNISKLFQKGRAKGSIFGAGAIDYISDIVFQIKEGDIIDNVTSWQMEFGKENEAQAIEWLRSVVPFGIKIVHDTGDSDEIVFRTWGEGGGDSPDGDAFNEIDKTHQAVIEVKCPANKKKACELTEVNKYGEPVKTRLDVLSEYNDQFAGHLIAAPEAKELWYVIYNAHQNSLTGEYYDRGVLHKYKRAELQPLIEKIEYRIPRVYEFIKLCVKGDYKPEDINVWWAQKEYKI